MIDILKISLIAYMFCALGQKGMIFEWYQNLICQLPEWLCKPTGGCFKCFTGQVMFWTYLINHFALGNYDFYDHLFFVSAGIFASVVYNKVYLFLND